MKSRFNFEFQACVIVVLCAQELLQSYSVYSNRISLLARFSSKSKLESRTNATLPIRDSVSSAIVTTIPSVHLQLTQLHRNNEEQNTAAATTVANNTITILEFFNVSTNEILLGTIEDIGWEFLEHYSIHKFATNFSLLEGVIKRERKVVVDPPNNSLKEELRTLWISERFLAKPKKFPLSSQKDDDRIEAFVKGHITRLKNLKKDRTTVSYMSEFLTARIQSIAEKNVSYYIHDPTRSFNESKAVMKTFLTWFRDEFPYYYSACTLCGCNEGNNFYGLVHPTREECLGQAMRTELYLCATCNLTSRFPRYNDVTLVLNTRRGRCGEYSVLMMRLLQSLGYRARWTVDRADHVWTEVLLSGEWVHVDPCEAAVDEPLLYQSWGKNQTFIFAYEIDVDSTSADSLLEYASSKGGLKGISAVDVTYKYTTDTAGIEQRRLAEGVNQTYIDELLAEAAQQIRIFHS